MRESPTRFVHNMNKHKWLYTLLLLSSSILFYSTHFRFNSLAILDAAHTAAVRMKPYANFIAVVLSYYSCAIKILQYKHYSGWLWYHYFIHLNLTIKWGREEERKWDLIMQTCICATMLEEENFNVIGWFSLCYCLKKDSKSLTNKMMTK